MADIRIKDLPTTATQTASDDFIALDGTVNGTRKIDASAPSFKTSVTSPSVVAPASTALTLTGGSTGASLVLGQGATAANASITPTGTGSLIVTKNSTGNNVPGIILKNGALGYTELDLYSGASDSVKMVLQASDTNSFVAFSAGTNHPILFGINSSEKMRIATTGNLLIGGTTDIPGSGGLKVFGTTAASSTTTGALQVGSNVGLSGNAGGASYFGGDIAGKKLILDVLGEQLTMTRTGVGTAVLAVGGSAELYGKAASYAFYNAAGSSSYLTIASNAAATFAGAVTVSSTTTGSAGAGALIVTGGLSAGNNGNASYFGGAVSVAGATTAAAGAIGVTSADPSLRFKATGSVVADQNTYEIRNVGSTSNTYLQFRTVNDANSVFTTRMALWNSGGLYLGGSGAFADPGAANLWIEGAFRGTSLSSPSGTALILGTTSFGTAVTFASATGAATFAGAVAIGNTVNTVSPTSPNRTVTMVIGGVTYYLAAKTTND